MIICPDCCVDVRILGVVCLQLLTDCIDYDAMDILLAFDTRHKTWRLRKNGYRPSNDLQHALGLLERNGYLISTEISEYLVGVCVNWDKALYDEESDIICWCTPQVLE